MNRSKQDIEEFLNESLEFDSDTTELYDSNADPEYLPKVIEKTIYTGNNDNIISAGPSRTLSLSSSSSDDESASESSSDSSNDDEPDTDFWVETYVDIPDFNFCRDNVGIQFEINDSARNNPIEIFKQFWTNEIIDIIVRSINNYGEKIKVKDRPHKKGSRSTHFQQTCSQEVQNFLGLCLLGGSIKFSVVRDMFSDNPLYYHPIVRHIMSGRRFEQLLRCFSVEYASDNPLVGPMKKVYPVFDMLIQKFQSLYFPDENLSLDESLLLHRGRLKWRQYIKNKKAKYGIKFYELCSHDGYVSNIDMYKGKNQQLLNLTLKVLQQKLTVLFFI